MAESAVLEAYSRAAGLPARPGAYAVPVTRLRAAVAALMALAAAVAFNVNARRAVELAGPVVEVDVSLYPLVPRGEPGQTVRVRGTVVLVERRTARWSVYMMGHWCELADGETAADLVPGDRAVIVGEAGKSADPRSYPVRLIECRRE